MKKGRVCVKTGAAFIIGCRCPPLERRYRVVYPRVASTVWIPSLKYGMRFPSIFFPSTTRLAIPFDFFAGFFTVIL